MFTSGAAILAVSSLVGWTPSAYDVSIWHSLWFLAHKRQTGESPTLKAARLDFNIGYWFSSFTSVCFLTLGACLMFQMNEKFPPDPVGFAGALINLYVKNFGEWCRPFLGLCAFSAMFSTVLNVTDGFPRVLSMLTSRFSEPERAELPAALNKRVYWIAMGLISLVAVLILALVPNVPKTPGGFSFGMLILVATTLSFLSAPFIGLLSHRAMFAPEIAPELRPGRFLRVFSLFSIVFNVGFGTYFVWLRFLS